MAPTGSIQQANADLIVRVGELIQTDFANADEDLFADDFVFHYFNPNLPHLNGDHRGLDGLRGFFGQLSGDSGEGFHNEPHVLTPFGDELLIATATNTVEFGGAKLDVDAVVVWRVVEGRIQEAWDIPAINTVRPHPPGMA